MADRVGDSAPNMSRTIGDESNDEYIDASVEEILKWVDLSEIDLDLLEEPLEIQGPEVEMPEEYSLDDEYADDSPEEHAVQEIPLDEDYDQGVSVQEPDRKPDSITPHDPSINLEKILSVEWDGQYYKLSDPLLFSAVKQFVGRHEEGDSQVLQRIFSGSSSMLDVAKQYTNYMDKHLDRKGISHDILVDQAHVDIYSKNFKMPNYKNYFDHKTGNHRTKDFNADFEAYRQLTQFPGLHRKMTGIFILDGAKRLVQYFNERNKSSSHSITFRSTLGPVFAASESALMLAKREITAKIHVDLKRKIEIRVRTNADLKKAIKSAMPSDPNAQKNIDLFGRTFRLKKGESLAKAATRAKKEYKKSVADRISTLEKQGLLPVLAAAVAQARGASTVTAADVKQAQAIIKAAKTSFNYYKSPRDLVLKALGSDKGIDKLMAALDSSTRRHELVMGLQTFGRTMSRLHDGSATIKAANRNQGAQFAADALLRSAFDVPGVELIRGSMKSFGWSMTDAKSQNVRLRGLDKHTINALGDPAPPIGQATKVVREVAKAISKPVGPAVNKTGAPVSPEDLKAAQEAVTRLRRQLMKQSPPKPEPEDDDTPKR